MLMKDKKGVSMLTLIITIVVILILAAVTMQKSSYLPDETHYTKYMHVMKNVQTGVENKKITNSRKGTTEEKLNAGFKKVKLENVPVGFVSFDKHDEHENSITGYLVDLEEIGYIDAEYGKEYINFESGDTLKFGDRDQDVFVYDAEWTVYYVEGLEYDGSMNYTFK